MIDKRAFLNEYRSIIDSRELSIDSKPLGLIGEFFYLLASWDENMNLTGFKNIKDYVDFHLVDSFKLLQRAKMGYKESIIDVGTGAGIPGFLFKLMRDDIKLTLLETTRKKCDFHKEVVKHFGLGGCTLLNMRAEDAAMKSEYRETYDKAIARALAPIPVCLELTVGFVRENGSIYLPRGINENILSMTETCLETLPITLSEINKYDIEKRERTYQLAVFKKMSALNTKYPRKPGQIKKRPL